MPQSPRSEQLRDLQAHTLPLLNGKHVDDIENIWVLTTPGLAQQHESEANTIGANGHNSIHSNFDAIHMAPKPAGPTRTSQARRTISNPYMPPKPAVPTPISQGRHTISDAPTMLTPGDLSARRPPLPSSDNAMTSLASLAGLTSRQSQLQPIPLPSLPPSGARKRRMPSEPAPLSQSSKRQRVVSRPVSPSEEANQLQVKTAAYSSRQSEIQGLQIPPASAAGSALSLFESGPMPGEKVDGNRAAERQSKGKGLRINTMAAESAAPTLPENETTSEEKLYADYVTTHEEFRKELDNLAHGLNAAKKRADAATLHIQTAENIVYQANNAGFAKLKVQEDKYKKENEAHRRANRLLVIRCHTLERKIDEKNQEINELKLELEQGR